MRTLFIINTHSMVDLITNSSTELFVCNTDKTLEVFNEILKTNKKLKGYEKPWVFNLKEYREWRALERERKKQWKLGHVTHEDFNDSPYYNIEGWFYDEEDEEDLKYLRCHYIEHGDTRDYRYDNNPFRERIQKELLKYKENDRYKGIEEITEKIYDEIEEIDKKPNWWKNPLKYYPYSKMPASKLDGCIMLMGDGDNSMPYEQFDWIEETFNATRFHLG